MAIKNNTSQNPTYSFPQNTEMGMFPAGPNQLGFATDGGTGMVLDSSKNLAVTGNITGTSVIERVKTLEELSHKTISLSNTSTDVQYPSAKAAYDFTVESTLFCGSHTLPTITDNGNGTVTIGAGQFVFAADADGTPPRKRYTIAGDTYSLTDNAINFMLVDLNGGSPIMYASTSNATVNAQTIYPVFVITRTGNNLDIIDLDHEAKGLPNKITLRLARTDRIKPEMGGILLGTSTSPAVRTVTITAGRAWFSATATTLPAFNSGTNSFTFYYHVAGVWTASAATQFNNTQYDDGTNLQTLTNNRYAVCFIYRNVANNSNKAYMVLGQGDYNLGSAEVSSPPSPLPPEVANTLFVGRIIVEKNSDTPAQIASAFASPLALSGITDHESLSNLQGGSAGDHSHVTATERTYLQGLQTAVSTSGANTTFNGTITTNSLATVNNQGIFSYGFPAGALNIGADANSTARTANTQKLAFIAAPEYTNSRTINVLNLDSQTSSTAIINIGGKVGGSTYAATTLNFLTAPNTSTTGGTVAVSIDSLGEVTAPLQTLSSPSSLLTKELGCTLADTQTISGLKTFTNTGAIRVQNTIPTVWFDETDGATPKGLIIRLEDNLFQLRRSATNFGAGEVTFLSFDVNAPADSLTMNLSGNVGVGVSSPSARIHANSTTEQLRLGYNETFYTSIAVNSGATAIVGGTADWRFSNNTEFMNGVAVYGSPVNSDLHYRATSTAPGLWLDMGTTAKSCYLVLFGGTFQIQRRGAGFGESEANIMNLNLAAPNGSFFMDSSGKVTIPKGLVGVTDASNANAGCIGEYQAVVISTGVTMTNNTAITIGEITLGAGDWDVEGVVNITYASATVTQAMMGFHTADNVLPSAALRTYSGLRLTTTSVTDGLTSVRRRLTVNTTSTFYMVALSIFSAGTASGFGTIQARRVR